ncbi:MAG: hypothetical protein JKY34_09825 [Kordiimonadaceae bacterium]|nr:hypothetical protein [Kordiimonadaceae bacterium]
MKSIATNLKALSWVIYLLLVIVGVSPFLHFVFPGFNSLFPPHELLTQYGGLERLEIWQQIGGFFVAAWPAALLCWALILILRLMALLKAGMWFDKRSETICSQFSRAMMWFVAAQVLHKTLLVLIFTATRPAGERILFLAFNLEDAFALLPAIFALIFAHIVSLARQQREELQQII